MSTKEILVKLQYIINGSDGNYTAILSHPDLQGHLYVRASSEKLLDVQLAHLNEGCSKNTDPITTIINSVDKLVEGAKDLKEALKK
jgi:hypothetical protein